MEERKKQINKTGNTLLGMFFLMYALLQTLFNTRLLLDNPIMLGFTGRAVLLAGSIGLVIVFAWEMHNIIKQERGYIAEAKS